MTLTITPLTPADFDEAGSLLDLAFGGTGQAETLRRYYPTQSKYFTCAWHDDRIVGAVGASNYGSFGYIGQMGVHPAVQKGGIGTALMTHVIGLLEADGCMVQLLDATAKGEYLYRKLGFVEDSRAQRWDRLEHIPLTGTLPPVIRRAKPEDALEALDERLFGAPRPRIIARLLELNPGRAFVSEAEGRLTGYAIAQGWMVGPWLAESATDAEALLQAALTLEYDEPPRVIFNDSNAQVRSIIERYGFTQSRSIAHMRRGGNAEPRNLQALYGQASFGTS